MKSSLGQFCCYCRRRLVQIAEQIGKLPVQVVEFESSYVFVVCLYIGELVEEIASAFLENVLM